MSTIAIARSGIIPQTPGSVNSTCKRKCPGGYQCACDAIDGHALHICRNKNCWCHSQDRYEGRRHISAER